MATSLERATRNPPLRWAALARGLGVLALYFLSGKFGLSLAYFNASASPIWPPTGLALAIVLLGGYRYGLPIFAGAFLVNITTEGSALTSATIAIGNTLEALLGAWLVQRFVGSSRIFDRPRHILSYAALSAVLSTTVSSTVGVSSLCLGGLAAWQQFGATWLTWWLGDMVSDLTIAPLILIWATQPRTRWSNRQLAEASALIAILILIDAAIFTPVFPFKDKHIPIGYMALLPLLWAAFRFGQRGAITSAIITAGFASFAAVRGIGPFSKPDLNESLILAQAFVAAMTLTALLVAAVVSLQGTVQRALRAAERELRLITDLTPVMLTRCTRDLRYAFVNRAYASMLGRTPEEVVGKPIIEVVGPEGFETIRPYVERVLKGELVEYETDVHFTGVGLRHLRVGYKPEQDERGEIRGWVASITDITEHKQAELARARLSAIVQSSDDAIISKDLQGKIVTWNQAAERMFGYTANEIVGQRITRIVPEELHPLEEQILEQLRRGQTIHHYETIRRAKNGANISVSLTISPLRDDQGNVVGASSSSRDITQRKRTEDALAKARAQLESHASELERIVAQRTQQLRETNAELEAFSYSLSHDLRAPLRSIRNFTQLVLEERRAQLGEEAAANLERVVSATKRMDRLIRDVLALSRISRQDLSSRAIDIENLLLTITNERAEFQPPKADIQICSPLPLIRGDEASLSQCVANLLENAVKFVPAGTRPRIVIRAQNLDGKVRLWFEDNGIGIEPGAQQTIFEMFQRAHGGGQYEGSGLGLAIVRKAVQRMGGQVGVESEVGRGSRFWVELPKG